MHPEARGPRRDLRGGSPRVVLGVVAAAPLLVALFAGRARGDASAPAASASPSPPASVAAPRATTVFLHPPPSMTSVELGRTLPDPTALVSKDQWVYDLRHASGELYLLGIHRLTLAAAQATPRAMGRFAFELYEGATLLERARFDFPMLGDDAALAPPAPPSSAGTPLPIHGRPLSLVAKASSRVGVMFPAAPRGTRLEIVDRATGRRWPLPWPPTELTATEAPPASSAAPADPAPPRVQDGG